MSLHAELEPQRPVRAWSLPRIYGHTVFSDLRDHQRPEGSRRVWWGGRQVWRGVDDPIFVLGSPRSGTTFLGEALAAVPELSYHHEPVATKAFTPYVHAATWKDRKARRRFRFVARLLLGLHFDGDKRYVDKTPSHVFLTGFLAATFPESLFIHVIRDGRDVALSWSKRPWLRADAFEPKRFEPGGYRYGPTPHFWVEAERIPEFRATTDLHRCAWGWRRHVEAWLDAATGLPPERMLQVRYEELVIRPHEIAGEIADFLGLDPEGGRALTTAAGNADPASVGGWVTGMSPAETNLVEAEIGPTLRRVGY